MITFQVPDMTCGRCASAIAKAIAAVDKTATTEFGMSQKLVRVSGAAPAADLAQAIQSAGYTPQEVQTTAASEAATSRGRGGCCCSGRQKPEALDAARSVVPAPSACCA